MRAAFVGGLRGSSYNIWRASETPGPELEAAAEDARALMINGDTNTQRCGVRTHSARARVQGKTQRHRDKFKCRPAEPHMLCHRGSGGSKNHNSPDSLLQAIDTPDENTDNGERCPLSRHRARFHVWKPGSKREVPWIGEGPRAKTEFWTQAGMPPPWRGLGNKMRAKLLASDGRACCSAAFAVAFGPAAQ